MNKIFYITVVSLLIALTAPAREAMEWCVINSYEANSTNLLRVLLIGDSITVRYASTVRSELKDAASLSSLGTSKAIGDPALLDEVRTILRQYKFAVVHFNIGLHGFEPTAYRNGFPELLATIRQEAPEAKLIWATTTPCRGESTTERVRNSNAIAAEFVTQEKIVVNDLFGLVMNNTNNPAVLWDGGGVHFTTEGADLQGKQVADAIRKLLP